MARSIGNWHTLTDWEIIISLLNEVTENPQHAPYP